MLVCCWEEVAAVVGCLSCWWVTVGGWVARQGGSEASQQQLPPVAACSPPPTHTLSPRQAGQHDDLAKYLLMVRKKVKDPKVRAGQGRAGRVG